MLRRFCVGWEWHDGIWWSSVQSTLCGFSRYSAGLLGLLTASSGRSDRTKELTHTRLEHTDHSTWVWPLAQPTVWAYPTHSVGLPNPQCGLAKPTVWAYPTHSVGLPNPQCELTQPTVWACPTHSVGLPNQSMGLPNPQCELAQPTVGWPIHSVSLPNPQYGLIQPSVNLPNIFKICSHRMFFSVLTEAHPQCHLSADIAKCHHWWQIIDDPPPPPLASPMD